MRVMRRIEITRDRYNKTSYVRARLNGYDCSIEKMTRETRGEAQHDLEIDRIPRNQLGKPCLRKREIDI